MERIPGWLERILLPRLSEMSGEIKAVNARIDELDKRLSGNDGHLAEKIDELGSNLSGKIEDLDKRLDMAQRLSVLEVKLSELKSKE